LVVLNWPRVLLNITQHKVIIGTPALLERTRPRDLYDVIHLWDRRDEVAMDSVREVLKKKCAAKNVAAPTAASLSALVKGSAELRADWNGMLNH